MEKRSVLNTPRVAEMKRKRHEALRNKIILSSVVFVLFFIGFGFLANWQKINIEQITVSGNKIIDSDVIITEVQAQISGKYLFVFPKSNFALYPKGKIKKDLSVKFPRLDDISLNVQNFKELQIEVSEREGKYTWCGDALPTIGTRPEDTKCHFMDSAGVVFDEAPYFSGDVYFRFYGKYNDTLYFNKLINLKENIERMGLRPSSLVAKADNDMEMYLSSGKLPPDAPKIVFKSDSDFDKLAENLQAAISTEPLLSQLKNEYAALEYIDLRFGNKVYYRFK